MRLHAPIATKYMRLRKDVYPRTQRNVQAPQNLPEKNELNNKQFENNKYETDDNAKYLTRSDRCN